MTGKGDRETSRARAPQDNASVRSILRRARIYLDAGSPGSSHELLSPAGLSLSALDGLAIENRFEALMLQLRSCQELGHAEHVSDLVPGLENLLHDAPSVCADLRAEGVVVVAGWHNSRGAYAQAAAIVNEFLGQLDDRELSVSSFVSLSMFRFDGLIREGRIDEAEDIASICVEKADRENAPLPAGIARNLLAVALKARGQLADALKLYTQAGARFAVAGDCVWAARVHLNRAALLNRIGRLPEAHTAYEEAYRRNRELSRAASVMRSRIGLGMVSIRQGNLDAARQHLLQGWLEARRLKTPREQALALEFLGEALTLMGRPQTARRALALCRRIATRIAPEGDLVAESGIREALLALTLGDPAEAEAVATQALACASKAGFAWEECQALRLRGIARFLLGRRDEARSDLQTAHDKLQTMGEELEIQLVRRWLARLDGEIAGAMPPLHPAQLALVAATPATAACEAMVPESTPTPTASVSSRRGKTQSNSRTEEIQEIWRRLGLATKSPRLLSMLHEAEMLAIADCAVLVQGETGTGKELLARGIHELSGRQGRLVPVNVGAITPDLFESELFGSEKGAYTGADHTRRGLVVEAEGGTLFLDEIGDIGPRGQVALLRFLDSGEVRPVGSHRISRVKLGVVTATNRLLKERILHDAFRQDLYYRLAQGVVTLPPLRDRLEDLPDLIQILWTRQGQPTELPPGLLDSDCLVPLRSHLWPGNVRELDQFLRRLRMSLDAKGHPRVSPHRIWTLLGGGGGRGIIHGGTTDRARTGAPEPPSTEQIRRILRECQGNRTQAARTLGIARSSFYRLLDERGLMGARPATGFDETLGEA
jgi:DNA-binding NtrC family response regulator/tetratricopeptide (TPR) repeat protein